MTGFLREYGGRLLDRGYQIIPISPGAKYPKGLSGWENIEATPADLKRWLLNGYASGGVGVLTKHTPAIDLDIRDKDVVSQLITWCKDRFGDTVERVGNAPKTLLVYRTDEPFPKMASPLYEDMFGQEHRIEILGDGQQFVAYATHPDTKEPYAWVSETDLASVDADDLPTLSIEDARDLINYFMSIIPDDWTEKERAAASKPVDTSLTTAERALLNAKPKADIGVKEVRTCLKEIEADDYNQWVKVGMALFHQFDGDSEGFEVWDEWSADSDKYDPDACRSRWNTFRANLSRHEPITFASVIRWAKDAYKERKAREMPKTTALLSLDQIMSKLGPVDWLIEDFIEDDASGVMFGEPGCYKSFLAFDMALAVATGRPWQGHPVKQGPVVYVAGEGHNGLARRIGAWFQHHDIKMDGVPFALTPSAVALTDEDTVKNLVEVIRNAFPGRRPAMVVIDTLAKNFGAGDENSTSDMNRFVDHVDRMIRSEFNCSTLIVHHTGHNNTDRARGARSLEAGVDIQYRVEKPADKVAKLTNVRMKNAAMRDGADYFNATEIEWVTEHGDTVGSLAFDRAEHGFDPVEEVPLKGKQKALFDLIAHEEEITREKLREVAIAEDICSSADSVKRAVGELKKKNLLKEEDGVLSVVFDF